MTVLAIDSDSDDLTRLGSQYRRDKVYPELRKKQIVVTEFKGAAPVRDLVKAAAKQEGVKYLTGVGHGVNRVIYTGNDLDEVYRVGNYEEAEVRGKIVHFLSCGIGNRLGKDFVSKGCAAFFGYKENFTFVEDAAEVFLECDSKIDLAFADGHTAEDVFVEVNRLFEQRVAELKAAGKIYLAGWLDLNRRNLCGPSRTGTGFGDPQAKLV